MLISSLCLNPSNVLTIEFRVFNMAHRSECPGPATSPDSSPLLFPCSSAPTTEASFPFFHSKLHPDLHSSPGDDILPILMKYLLGKDVRLSWSFRLSKVYLYSKLNQFFSFVVALTLMYLFVFALPGPSTGLLSSWANAPIFCHTPSAQHRIEGQ